MDVVLLIGRIMFSMLAIGSAVAGHFGATDDMAAYGEARGLGGSRTMVLVSGVVLAAAGISLALGIYPDLGALLYAGFLLSANFTIHHFWTDDDPMTRQMEMTQFMKNLAVAGGALIAFVYFHTVGDDAPFQITGNLF